MRRLRSSQLVTSVTLLILHREINISANGVLSPHFSFSSSHLCVNSLLSKSVSPHKPTTIRLSTKSRPLIRQQKLLRSARLPLSLTSQPINSGPSDLKFFPPDCSKSLQPVSFHLFSVFWLISWVLYPSRSLSTEPIDNNANDGLKVMLVIRWEKIL